MSDRKPDTTSAAIAAMLNDVTPGPWRVEHETTLIWGNCEQDDVTYRGMGYPVSECRITPISSWASGPDADAGEANARFIAASRDLVPALAAERDRLAARLEKAESDCAMFADANARQAMCISFTASNLGPEYSATIEGLPKSARHISAERDRLAAENERLRAGSRPFQNRVHDWIIACFGEKIGADRIERNHRFIEEALELVQSNGCTASEAHQLVDYVFSRPIGDPHQEVGGVMNTLAALCTASGLDMEKAGEDELTRVWTKIEQIRAKQAAKPKHSPLPAALKGETP